jgi:hypothetical protein
MDEKRQEMVLQFMSITDCPDFAQAKIFMENDNWDIEMAIGTYMASKDPGQIKPAVKYLPDGVEDISTVPKPEIMRMSQYSAVPQPANPYARGPVPKGRRGMGSQIFDQTPEPFRDFHQESKSKTGKSL